MVDFLKDMTMTATGQFVNIVMTSVITVAAGWAAFLLKKYAGVKMSSEQLVEMTHCNDLADKLAGTAVRAVEDKWNGIEASATYDDYTDKLTHATDLMASYLGEVGLHLSFNEDEIEDKVRAAYQREIGNMKALTLGYATKLGPPEDQPTDANGVLIPAPSAVGA